jgi:hypothetical protein
MWTQREIELWAAYHADPITRTNLLEASRPFSAYPSPTLFLNVLSWIVLIFFNFVFKPCFEEFFKRYFLAFIEHSAERTFHHLFDRRITFHVDTQIYPLLWFIFAVLGPCLILGVLEARRYTGLQWILQLSVRTMAHSILTVADFYHACLYHMTFNLFVTLLSASGYRLSVFDDHGVGDNIKTVYSDVCCEHYGLEPVATQDRFTVKWGEQECKSKFGVRMHWFFATFSRPIIGTVFRQCSHNEKVSITGRVGKRLSQHNIVRRAVMVATWLLATAMVLPLIIRLVAPVIKPTNWLAWIARFDPRKKEIFQRVRSEGILRVRRAASAFIKREVAMKDLESPYKDPRWIQGCPVEMTVAIGPYVHKLAKNVHKGLRPGGDNRTRHHFTTQQQLDGKQIIYTCGMNAEQVGSDYAAAIRLVASRCKPGEKVVVLEDDQSRFDQHITRPPFLFLLAVYMALLPRKVWRLLKRGWSSGFSKLGTAYRVWFTMQSGWPDTSVGDTLVNAAMKYFIHGIGRNWVSIVCGDDSITVTTDWEIQRCGGVAGIRRVYSDFGMDVEIILRANVYEAEFCSARFFPVGDTFVLMPKPGKLLAKLACDMVDRNAVNQLAWLRSISDTLAAFGRVDPTFLALSKSINRFTGTGRRIRLPENPYKYPVTISHSVSREDLLDYYDRFYGISAAQYDSIVISLSEDFYVGKVFRNPHLVDIVARDI